MEWLGQKDEPVGELVRVMCPVCKRTWLTNKESHEKCPYPQCGTFYYGRGKRTQMMTSDILVKEKETCH